MISSAQIMQKNDDYDGGIPRYERCLVIAFGLCKSEFRNCGRVAARRKRDDALHFREIGGNRKIEPLSAGACGGRPLRVRRRHGPESEGRFWGVLTNAVRHGNRNDPGKRVKIAFRVDRKKIFIVVMDQGEGLTPGGTRRHAPRARCAEDAGKMPRGILIAKQVFDSVEHIGRGNWRGPGEKRKDAGWGRAPA